MDTRQPGDGNLSRKMGRVQDTTIALAPSEQAGDGEEKKGGRKAEQSVSPERMRGDALERK